MTEEQAMLKMGDAVIWGGGEEHTIVRREDVGSMMYLTPGDTVTVNMGYGKMKTFRVLGEHAPAKHSLGDDPVPPKVFDLAKVACEAMAANSAATGTAIAESLKAMKRIINRAQTLPEKYERVEITMSRGPTLEFSGRLICEEEFVTRGPDPMKIGMEVWQTQRGAYVAASFSEPANRPGFENCQALVVEPDGDDFAMRCKVMDFFNWEDRARSMVRKQANWSFRMEVE